MDANPVTNRFRRIPLPTSVTPWTYNPEAWTPQPTMDEDLLWALEPFFTEVSTGDLDGTSTEDTGLMEEDEEAEEEEEPAQVTLAQIRQVTKDFKDTKKDAPSTAGGDTTVGTGTTLQTGQSSASTASTHGTTQLM